MVLQLQEALPREICMRDNLDQGTTRMLHPAYVMMSTYEYIVANQSFIVSKGYQTSFVIYDCFITEVKRTVQP